MGHTNDMFERLKSYTEKRAIDIIERKENIPPLWIIIRKGMTRFFKCYVSRKGYKEGKLGFLIALMAFLFLVISYLKATLEKKV